MSAKPYYFHYITSNASTKAEFVYSLPSRREVLRTTEVQLRSKLG